MTPKRLFFDIETSPNLVFSWNVGYKQKIDYQNIVNERAIICICWKWAGENAVHYVTWDSKQNDKKALEIFAKVIASSDESIGHNGDNFDIKWLRTRCLFHKIPLPPKLVTLDTLKAARTGFRFNSNRLDYISRFLGHAGKIKTEFGLWTDIVLHKSEAALKKMVTYCKEDVRQLEKVFNDMVNYIPHKTHHGVAFGEEKYSCPECGSDNIKCNRSSISAAGETRRQMKCNSCGKYYTISNKSYMLLLEDNLNKKNKLTK